MQKALAGRAFHVVAWGQAGGLAVGAICGEDSTATAASNAAEELATGVIVRRV
jgi:hypothetical protein